jgi:hypothetical protein
MKHLLSVSALVVLLVGGHAAAQQPAPAGQQGSKTTVSFRYALGSVSTIAANPTDWVVIGPSITKAVMVTNISVCGAAPNPSTIWVSLIKRSTADSAGTSVSPANLSGTNDAPTGGVFSYTANPSLGTPAGLVDTKPLNVGPGGQAGCVFLDYATRKADPPILRGTTSLGINLGGVAMPAGLQLAVMVETVEQP